MPVGQSSGTERRCCLECSEVLGELTLPFGARSARLARGFVRFVVRTWDVSHISPDAELCVSELVTNAYWHARPKRVEPLRVLISRTGSALRCEIHDESRTLPRVCDADELDESGRGMLVIATIADRHGWHLTARGKAVWFELEAWPAAAPSTPAP